LKYEAAGVSLAKADAVVERLRAAVTSTGGEVGGFAGVYPLDGDRLLVATTDGVGTKLMLSRRAGRLYDAGRDLAAHCIDDVLTTGADPLFFLDYVASGTLDVEDVVQLVEGAAAVCREAGCALLGGESAELPGIYREGELDFAGTCVGLVRRADLIDGSRCEPGDVILGLPSSGLHTNGFSLVRRLVDDEEFDADLLLAHVTGGGLLGNLTRVLPEGVSVEIDWEAWERPGVYAWLAEQRVPEEEQRRVFNLGVGMCAVVPERDAGTGTVIGRLA
jgi:phosphoribosylformylglycinamidine cyclo-ligase